MISRSEWERRRDILLRALRGEIQLANAERSRVIDMLDFASETGQPTEELSGRLERLDMHLDYYERQRAAIEDERYEDACADAQYDAWKARRDEEALNKREDQ